MVDIERVKRFIRTLPFDVWTPTKGNQDVINLLKKERWGFNIEFSEGKFVKRPIPEISEESLNKFNKEKLVSIIITQNKIINDVLNQKLK